jgi:ketosteroid isomerase-like protein
VLVDVELCGICGSDQVAYIQFLEDSYGTAGSFKTGGATRFTAIPREQEDPFMKPTSSELLMRNFNEIFIELDPVKRAALLAESYTDDCLWIHPGGRIVGREGINEAATEIRKHFPEYRYTVTGEIQVMHNVATCRWGSGMPGQPFHYTGTDFLEERDGRVSRLYTFIDQKLFQS